MIKKVLLAFYLFLGISFTYLYGQNYYELSSQESYQLWLAEKSNPNFVIIDIRTADEFKGGFIENAINIDYYKTDEFYDYFSKLDKSKKYLLYCASSGRSGQAIAQFKSRNFNFNDMTDMKGGLNSWKTKGYPTTTQIPTSIGSGLVSNFSLNMHPNPSQGNLNLYTLNNQNLIIYNAIGNVVFEKECNNGLQTLNLNHLPKGLYVVKLKDINKTYMERLIID